MIVHHNQFPILAQFEEFLRLAHQRLQAFTQAVLLVARRDNDSKLQSLVRLRLVEDRSWDSFPVRRHCRGSSESPRTGLNPLPPIVPSACRLSFSISPHLSPGPFAVIIRMCGSLGSSFSVYSCRWPSRPVANVGYPAQIGQAAPDFTVSDGATTVHLASYRGRVVVLSFWATWCAPCIEEMPSLLEFIMSSRIWRFWL